MTSCMNNLVFTEIIIQMEQFEQVISAIKRGEDYPDQLQMVHSMLMDDSGNVQKELVKELLIAMSRIVSSADRPPNSKFYTIMVLSETRVDRQIVHFQENGDIHIAFGLIAVAPGYAQVG